MLKYFFNISRNKQISNLTIPNILKLLPFDINPILTLNAS